MLRTFAAVAAGVMLLAAGARAAQTPPFLSFTETDFAIANVRVVDGTGAAVHEDWTVIVHDGRIVAAGPSATTPVPAAARAVDGRGDTLLPGLIGMHEHLYYELDPRVIFAPTMVKSAPRLYLAAGVTTARTTGSMETYTELNLKRRIDAGLDAGPTLDVTGPYLSGPDDPLIVQQAALTSPDDARQTVDFWTARGVTSFKAFLAITLDELKAVIDEAHRRGALVTGHLCSVTMSEAADAGIDELEHGIVQASDFVDGKQPDRCPSFRELGRSWGTLEPTDPRVLALTAKLVAHHVAVTSTLAVMERDLGLAPPLSQTELGLLDPTARAGYEFSMTQEGAPASIARHIMSTEMAFERAFVAAGGLLTMGADTSTAVLPGFTDQREIELLATAGFTPVDAIQIATANGARAMHLFDRTGSIAVGKAADLLLVRGDVTRDVTAIAHPVLVVKRGVAYDPKKLIESVKGSVGSE